MKRRIGRLLGDTLELCVYLTGPIFPIIAIGLIGLCVYIFFIVLTILKLSPLAFIGNFLFSIHIIILMSFNYYMACTTNSTVNTLEQIENVALNSQGFPKTCKKCLKYKPKRTHHCSVCKTCILKMDHHCPWLNNWYYKFYGII